MFYILHYFECKCKCKFEFFQSFFDDVLSTIITCFFVPFFEVRFTFYIIYNVNASVFLNFLFFLTKALFLPLFFQRHALYSTLFHMQLQAFLEQFFAFVNFYLNVRFNKKTELSMIIV